MEKVKALEHLEDQDYCWKLTQDGFENLLMRAGFRRGEAHEMALKHGWNRMNAGEVV